MGKINFFPIFVIILREEFYFMDERTLNEITQKIYKEKE